MKRAILTICVALVVAATAFAKEKKLVTTCFNTDIHCDKCKEKIMNNIPVLGKGIEDVTVDVPSKVVCVTFNSAKTDNQRIIDGLGALRVKATIQENDVPQNK